MNYLPFTPAAHAGRFDDLIFTPLDMPQPPSVDVNRLVEWMGDNKKVGLYWKNHYERLTGRQYPWLARSVFDDLTPLAEAFPEVLDYALLYPFESVRAVIFLAQDGHQSVFPHSDSDGLTGMRFYLENRHVEGLHFYKGKEKYDTFNSNRLDENGNPISIGFENYFDMSERIYARFPPSSRAFMVNSARAIHAVDANTCKLGDRIAVLVQGKLDVNRFEALIDASLKRYGEYAIWH